VLIAEMLLLTALNDKGNVPVGSGALIQVGLTGALLADLAIDGLLTVAEDGTVRAGDTRPGDELLADVYDAVREHLQGRNVRQVIGGLSHHIGGSWNRVVDRLIAAGVLGRDRPSLLRPTRHPVLDAAARQAVLDQIRAAAAGEGPVSSQVAVVLALIGPCRLLERVAPDPGTRGEAKRRIDRATAETPFAPGVAKIVDELIVAITVAATTVPPSFVLAARRDVLEPGAIPGATSTVSSTGAHAMDARYGTMALAEGEGWEFTVWEKGSHACCRRVVRSLASTPPGEIVQSVCPMTSERSIGDPS
jgi:hypothetical protein